MDGKRTATKEVDIEGTATTAAKWKNVGGTSKVEWFNPLVTDPRLQTVRENRFSKIRKTKDPGHGHPGCKVVIGFDDTTRPIADKMPLELFKSVCPTAPARYSPYAIAMAMAGKLVPAQEPPPYPATLRQVKHKRTKLASEGNEKGATWVVSHRCHFKSCVEPDHLVWEPSCFNRLRDNCPGGDACLHRPDPCLIAHRNNEIIDWTIFCIEK